MGDIPRVAVFIWVRCDSMAVSSDLVGVKMKARDTSSNIITNVAQFSILALLPLLLFYSSVKCS